MDLYTSFAEYPNHTLKQNRTYQIGWVLADKFGRQSSVILSEYDTTSTTAGTLLFGGSTVFHPYYDENDLYLLNGQVTQLNFFSIKRYFQQKTHKLEHLVCIMEIVQAQAIIL